MCHNIQHYTLSIVGNNIINMSTFVFSYSVCWLQVVENEITVSKGGFATVEVEQTVPMGCNEPDSSACNVDLNLFDPNLSQNPCDAGISAVNADDDDMCANVIKVIETTYSVSFI